MIAKKSSFSALVLLLVSLSLIRLLAKVLSLLRISVDGIRIKNREVQTATDYYYNPSTKRSVTIIGVVHQAERRYFRHIQELLNKFSYEGNRIVYEGFRKMKLRHEGRLGENERVIFGALRGRTFPREWSEVMPIACQKDELVYRKNWINGAMSELDFIRLMAVRDCHISISKTKFSKAESLQKTIYKSDIRSIVNNGFKNVVARCAWERLTTHFFRRKRMWNEIILDHRNVIAVCAIARNLKSSDVVTIWGAAHLRGIGEHLKDMGVRKNRRTWLDAYRIRKYSFWDPVVERMGDREEKFLSPLINEFVQKNKK